MATATQTATAQKVGKVVQIIGPVVDVEFEGGHLPEIYNAVRIVSYPGDAEVDVVSEVEQHLGSNPGLADTNHDGRPDGSDDTDRDGVPNVVEQTLGLDPKKADTGNEGVKDGARDADGDGFSNALLGNFDTYSEANNWPIGSYLFWTAEWYVQDNWRVSRRLTGPA